MFIPLTMYALLVEIYSLRSITTYNHYQKVDAISEKDVTSTLLWKLLFQITIYLRRILSDLTRDSYHAIFITMP